MSRLLSKKQLEFWVSNISDRNVCLRDLALTIKARNHVNLLDSRHYSYTLEQLEKSALDGSLHKKSNMLKVRKVPPPEPIKKILQKSTEPIPRVTSVYSLIKIEEPHYEELEVSEIDFINQITEEE
jgi:hypothetical protein